MAEHVRSRSDGRSRTRSGGPVAATLGVIGELLITVAVVLALFAVWQLYWTTWQVAGPRDQQITQFEQDNAPVASEVGEIRTDTPPPVAGVVDGEIYGVLHIPSWDWMKTPLAEGTAQAAVLDKGYAGHYSTTAQPGEVGNFSVAGHRRTYGNNFRHIDRLKEGDTVVVETTDTYYVYTFRSNEIVEPEGDEAISVIAPVPDDVTFSEIPTQRMMTMTTCHPEYGNSQRFIVHLELVSWTPKDTGIPQELVGEPDS